MTDLVFAYTYICMYIRTYLQYIYVILYNIRRPNGQEGFVPRNYVKEIEPTVVKTVTKKKVMKPEKVKMRKKRTEKQRVPKTFRRSALCMSMLIIQTYILAFVSVYVQYTDPSRMYTTRSDASSGVVSRQQGINDTYDMLLTLAKVCVSIHQSMYIHIHVHNITVIQLLIIRYIHSVLHYIKNYIIIQPYSYVHTQEII